MYAQQSNTTTGIEQTCLSHLVAKLLACDARQQWMQQARGKVGCQHELEESNIIIVTVIYYYYHYYDHYYTCCVIIIILLSSSSLLL